MWFWINCPITSVDLFQSAYLWVLMCMLWCTNADPLISQALCHFHYALDFMPMKIFLYRQQFAAVVQVARKLCHTNFDDIADFFNISQQFDLLCFCSFNVTHSTVRECVTRITDALLELEGRYINWPTDEEMAIEEATFFTRYGK